MKPRKPIKRRLNASGLPRERFEGLRDEDYRKWVREQPCAIRAMEPAVPGHYCWSPEGRALNDAAHVKGKATGAGDAGNLVSLCRRGHQELHAYGIKSFQRAHAIDLEGVAALLWNEYQRYGEPFEPDAA